MEIYKFATFFRIWFLEKSGTVAWRKAYKVYKFFTLCSIRDINEITKSFGGFTDFAQWGILIWRNISALSCESMKYLDVFEVIILFELVGCLISLSSGRLFERRLHNVSRIVCAWMIYSIKQNFKILLRRLCIIMIFLFN